MKSVQITNYLEFNDNVIESVRAKYNLDGPGRMEEALDILRKWIEAQPHFMKKDFQNIYLETSLIGRKGSIERTKILLDRMCTQRTLMPQYFGRDNVSRDFEYIYDSIKIASLPKPTKENHRIFICKVYRDKFSTSGYVNFFKLCIVGAEYIKIHDYQDGVRMVLDLTDVNVMEVASKIDLIITRQGGSLLLEGYGFRLLGLHLITDSKLVSALVNILKAVIGPKLAERIFVHKNVTELHDCIEKEILPKEYGGDERSFQELFELWKKTLSSETHLEHLEDMMSATTDESRRPLDKFVDSYAGMPGTFRALKVD